MSFRKLMLFAIIAVISAVSPSYAVIVHNDADAPSVRPVDVVGRWSSNASCVAIGRSDWTATNYIVTTRHQGGGVGSTVNFGGVNYVVAEVFYEPSADGLADLRVCRIEKTAANGGGNANLTSFANWYSGTSEVGNDIVVGGFGKTRGTSGSDNYGTYYTWAGSNNWNESWGSNGVDSTASSIAVGSYSSEVLRMDFGRVSDKDCGMAEYDSGGGWFMDVDPTSGTEWQLVALNAYVPYVTDPDRSYYGTRSNLNQGIRISSYSDWIDSTIPAVPEPGTLAVLGLGGVAVLIRRRKARRG